MAVGVKTAFWAVAMGKEVLQKIGAEGAV